MRSLWKASLLFVSAALCLGACGKADTETEAMETDTTLLETTEETEMTIPESWQLIPDPDWQHGFTVMSQKDHNDHDRVTDLDTWQWTDAPAAPLWKLAQWDSGPCLVENRVSSDPWEYTDGTWRSLRYDKTANSLTFRLDTSLYYGGKPALAGDWWPHLLIEQPTFRYDQADDLAKPFYHCDSDRMVVSFDIRLTDYSHTPVEGSWVDAAQFLMYFYVKGVETQDFCWFGLQLFDNRWAENDHYIGYDGGKADASGAMIYSIGSKYIYEGCPAKLWKNGAPDPSGEWIHVELDLAPYLRDMFDHGRSEGYFQADSLRQLIINGMNLGWETISTFDHTMEIANVRLTSYRD